MLVSDQLGLAVLEPSQKLAQRLSGAQPHPHRQGVNEQANHGLDAGNLRGPAGHRRAEDHVVVPGQPAQQDGPGALEDRVEGQAVAASLTAERLGECFGQFDNDLFRQSRSRRPRLGRCQPGRLLQPGQRTLPSGLGRLAILPGDPAQIVPVGGHPRQSSTRPSCP